VGMATVTNSVFLHIPGILALIACSGQRTTSEADASVGGTATGGNHGSGGSGTTGGTGGTVHTGGTLAMGGAIGVGGSAFSTCNSSVVCNSNQVYVRLVNPALGQQQCACILNPCGASLISCTCGNTICAALGATCAGYMPDSGALGCSFNG